ncbi:hypothetical protein Y032_0010g1058 [Ancylostoma ceylanicum]|uniref:Uncharacterized protein n=1 Tax=Ancylostoma ceylanicum TaxID=53326 RepID=A0A016VFS5_9BILA|nr:hypothetical protein Y032_0010g1058 [Ancylostoma ceylanicum]
MAIIAPRVGEDRANQRHDVDRVRLGQFIQDATYQTHQNMTIITLQGEEISASHLYPASTAADGDDLLSHSAERPSHVLVSPKMWRRDVQVPDLTAITLYYWP